MVAEPVDRTSPSEAKIALLDVGKELNLVLDAILRALIQRQRIEPTAAPLRFVRRE